MDKRLAKQIIYGIFYLAIISIFFGIIYFVSIKSNPTCFDSRQNQKETGVDCGGPCSDCEIKTLSSIQLNFIKSFPSGNKSILAAEIKNPNGNYGADNFSYLVDIYGSGGEKIKNIFGKSFIYAGEIKYIIEVLDIDYKEISEMKISFSDINWLKKEEFERPKTQIREVSTKLNDGKSVEVSGVIVNENAFSLSKVRIAGFLNNRSNIKISASKTELENIEAFGETSFKIIFPKGISLAENAASSSSLFNFNIADPNKTSIYIETIR